MKKVICLMLAILVMVTVACSACAENNVKEYSKKIKSTDTWNRIDYNCVYQKAAKNVLPELLSSTGKTFNPKSTIVFGDETGEVWMIYKSEVYRVWFDENDRLVLTSTSDGLGFTGYGVFSPKK